MKIKTVNYNFIIPKLKVKLSETKTICKTLIKTLIAATLCLKLKYHWYPQNQRRWYAVAVLIQL